LKMVSKIFLHVPGIIVLSMETSGDELAFWEIFLQTSKTGDKSGESFRWLVVTHMM